MSHPHQREVAVFEAALQLPEDQREAYLEETCAGDPDLFQRIQALLDAVETRTDFLEPIAGATPLPLGEEPGSRIGPYKLLQQIGEGGCGVVYMAEQEQPIRRRVALKIIKLGMDTKQVIARFEAERQALALMDHPNIAKVHDAGATETGRPYFVMELVRGVKITNYCDEKKLSTRQRLELFIQVCQAVQHAHQKGIIHRDLKPSNILVTVNDGAAVVKVIDFGIAKATTGERLTDKTIFTAFEQFIGTPAYMSPEQTEITSVDIDTRTDVYSLGVLLYELLTGQTPFDAEELLKAGLDEMRRTLREKEPARPSTKLSTLTDLEQTTVAGQRQTDAAKLRGLLNGDLDWIVMKCLEKDRARRYETVNGLASDIRRHLNVEPVLARPPSRWYEFQKTFRRHKFVFSATAAVIAALITGLLIVMWSLGKQRASTKKAETEAAKSLQITKFFEEMLVGVRPSVAKGRDTTLLKEILDKARTRIDQELTNQPQVQVELLNRIGMVYQDISSAGTAEAIHRHALEIGLRLWGTNDLQVARSLDLLAHALMDEGRSAAAEPYAREGLQIRLRLLGSNDLAVEDSMETLAQLIYTSPPRLAEATALMTQAHDISRKMRGETNLDTADTLSFLGLLLSNAGKYDEGESAIRRAIAIEKTLRETNSIQLLNALSALAQLLHADAALAEECQTEDQSVINAKFAESEACFRDAMQLNWADLASTSIDMTLFGYQLLMLRERGKLQEVDQLLGEALRREKGVLVGEDTTLSFSAAFKVRDGRFAEAASELGAAAALNPEWPVRTYQWIAALAASGDFASYTNACQQALQHFSQSTNASDLERAANICLLLPSSQAQTAQAGSLAEKAATLELQQGKPELFLFAQGLAEYRRGNFAGVVNLARSQTISDNDVEATCILSMALERLGRTSEARASLAKALELATRYLPPPNGQWFSWSFENWLVAKILLREARQLVEGHPAQNPYEDLALALRDTSCGAVRTGHLTEAEILLRRTLALYGPSPGEEDYGLACTLLRLSLVLKAQGKDAEGREMADRARTVLDSHVASPFDDYLAANDLAWLLATSTEQAIRDGPKGLVLSTKAVEATGRKNPYLLDTLAAAHAEVGNFDDAVKVEKEAIAMTSPSYDLDRPAWICRLNLYQTHKAMRTP